MNRASFIGIRSFILPRKFYFRIPLKLGGLPPKPYMANKLLEIDGLTDTPHHRNHDPSFYNIRHILNNHRRTHNASYLLDPLGLKPILTHAPLLFLEISAPQKLAA